MRFLDKNSFCGILSSQLKYQIINSEFYDFSHFIQSTRKVGRLDLAFLVTIPHASTSLSLVAQCGLLNCMYFRLQALSRLSSHPLT